MLATVLDGRAAALAPQEIADYARYLNFDMTTDHHLLWVAEEDRPAPGISTSVHATERHPAALWAE